MSDIEEAWLEYQRCKGDLAIAWRRYEKLRIANEHRIRIPSADAPKPKQKRNPKPKHEPLAREFRFNAH